MENNQKKNIRQERINALVDQFLAMDYGDTLEHYKIEGIINIRQKDRGYQDIVQAAKKRLDEASRTVESVRKVGYRIIMPDEYSKKAVDNIRIGKKKIDHGTTILNNAPVDKMSLEAQNEYRRLHDRVLAVTAFVHGAYTEVKMLTAKKHPLLSQNASR